MAQAVAYIDGMAFDGIGPDAKPKTLHLVIQYGQKEAQIQLPAGVPRSAEEQKGTEPHRRELHELLTALQEVVGSPQGITWPPPR